MIRVVFEDNYLLVIDKPPGLVSTPAETVKGSSLADLLQADFGINLDRGGLVHRLDKDTSGLILAAKNKQVFEALQAEFKERRVKKQYLALVHGTLDETKVVEGDIARNPVSREKFTVLAGGRQAQTVVEPMQHLQLSAEKLQEIFADFNKIQLRKLVRLNYGRFTLVKCLPKTGRTHQIRVHLKYIGLPVVADQKYGGRKMNRLDSRWCPRMFLHAVRLEFTHPITGNLMEFESPLPTDLQKALENLNG